LKVIEREACLNADSDFSQLAQIANHEKVYTEGVQLRRNDFKCLFPNKVDWHRSVSFNYRKERKTIEQNRIPAGS